MIFGKKMLPDYVHLIIFGRFKPFQISSISFQLNYYNQWNRKIKNRSCLIFVINASKLIFSLSLQRLINLVNLR